MKSDSLESTLARKAQRAMRSARLSLRENDPDGAVNRSYYAMFNAARAALLSSGVSEADLPRTHRGVIEAFRNHAVQSGRVDAELASTLSRTESLRLKADYTGTEIDVEAAKQVVTQAEAFVRVVEREFGLQVSTGKSAEGDVSSQTHQNAIERPSRASSDDMRRKAREDWLTNYRYKDRNLSESAAENKNDRKEADRGTQQTQRDVDSGYEPE